MYCRKIGKNIHPSLHPFYFSLSTGIVGTLVIVFTGDKCGVINWFEFILLTVVGLCSWIQQLAQSIALQIEKGGRSAAVNYLIVVNSFLADAFFFGDAIKLTDVAGATFIVFFTFLSALLKCTGKTK